MFSTFFFSESRQQVDKGRTHERYLGALTEYKLLRFFGNRCSRCSEQTESVAHLQHNASLSFKKLVYVA